MNYRSKIIDIYHWNDLLFHIVDMFISERFELTKDERSLCWNEKKASNHVFFMLDDSFSRALKWRQKEKQHDVLIERVLREVIYTNYLKNATKDGETLNIDEVIVPTNALDDIYIAVDPIQILIDELVSETVSDNPWWVWEIEYVPKGSVLIRSIDDYRIKTFNEKVESGEWPFISR